MINPFGNAFFELSQDMLSVSGFDGRFIHLSPAWTASLGWTADELRGKSYLDFVHPDDRARSEAETAKLLEQGTCAGVENRFRHKDGGYRWLTWGAMIDLERKVILSVGRDVTTSKRDLFLMEQTREITRTGGWEIDLTTEDRRVYWTKETHRIFETNPETYKPTFMGIGELIAPEWRDLTDKAFRKLVSQGSSHDLELEALTPTGRRFWIRMVAKARVDAGKVSRIYGIVQDITPKKLADQARDQLQTELRTSHAFIRSIIDAVPDPIFVKNSERRFVWGNQALSKLLNLAPEAYIGKTDHDIFPTELADWFHKKDSEVFDSQQIDETEEKITDPENGGFRTIITKKVPSTLADGSQIIVGVIRDFTERKKTEERSRTLHALIEASDEAFAYFDLQGKPIFLNSAARDRFGLDPSAGSIARFFPQSAAERLFNEALPVASAGKTWENETWLLHGTTGEEIPVWQRVFSLRDEHGAPKYYAMVAMDIRQKKSAEAKLQHSAKLSALGEMAGGIAHEINNPLAIIHGRACQLVEIAKKGPVPGDVALTAAGKIETTAMRISKIVKALRSFAREMEGEPFEPVLAKSLIEDTLEFCRERFRNHSVRLDLELADPGLRFECMPVQLSQVLLNLLNNAFDAVSDKPDRWVRIDMRVDGQAIEMSVTDSGQGIPQHVVDRMMQPFFTTKDIGKGTGLGLSVSKGIIESHGGTLAYDRECANTRFVIRIPLRAGGSLTHAA